MSRIAVLTDLYEIVIHADTDKVLARMEKYRVKFTGKHYMPQRLTPEQEGQAYSHRLYQRVTLGHLMVVRTEGYIATDHVYRSIYCLADQRQKALALVMAAVEKDIKRHKETADKVFETWQKNSQVHLWTRTDTQLTPDTAAEVAAMV